MRSAKIHSAAPLAIAIAVLGGCSPGGPAASPKTIAACLAAVPLLPFFKPSLEELHRVREALIPELNARAPELNEVYIDEAGSKIVIGAAHPSRELCDDLHRRFGDFIEVVPSEPGGSLQPSLHVTLPHAE